VLILSQLWWVGGVSAAVYPQPPKDTPFTITGFIQSATLDDATNVLSGGTVTVNGTKVIIPKNTIVLMPGTFLSWQELWAKAPAPWGLAGNGQTGLALTDINPSTSKPPLTTYEITINGNCIPSGATTCTSVAGLVAISQQSLNVGQGVINYIDYANGELHVGGAPGVSSPTDIRVQINDPPLPGLAGGGRYSKGLSPDQRFTTDQDNPAIRAKTGYPMCIPRAVPPPAVPPLTIPPAETDPLCPQRNRPLDPATLTAPLGNFTIGPAPNSSPPGIVPFVPATPHPAGDPTRQAPFQVGDYIDYSGTLQKDTTGLYISAHQIVANLGIYTSPGANPAYMALEVTILGVGGFPITFPIDVPQEATGRIKALGFFTDPTRAVDLFAVDVDPCTGGETERLLLAGIAAQVTPWGRFRDVDRTCPVTGVGCGAPTRQWRARYSGTTDVTAANGLQALQYTIPVAEFIFSENTVYGDPTLLAVPLNIQDFPFLANGEGPWRGDATHIVGQLTPFPLTNSIAGLTPQVTTPVSCSPTALKPVANAGANQTKVSGAAVTLNGGASSDPNVPPATLTYQWSQTAGPALPGFPVFPSLTSPSSLPTMTFTAPTLQTGAIPVSLTFQLTVTNSFGLISTATTAVSVTPPPPHADSIVITAATYRARDGSLNVTANSTDTTCGAILTLSMDTGFSATMTKVGPFAGGCTYSYVNRPVFPQPSFVTVKSTLGGSATTTLTRVR
jgi:hypothetical protein